MREYCITSEDMKDIIDHMAAGYACVEYTAGDYLYIKLKKEDDIVEYEFVYCKKQEETTLENVTKLYDDLSSQDENISDDDLHFETKNE